VTFDIDANGILSVKAKERTTGKEQSIRITASSGLSKDDIERMRKDAEAHADADKLKQELIEVKNHADTLIYTAEKSLKDAGDKLPADVKSGVEAKISAVKAVKDGTDKDAIEKSLNELSEELMKIGDSMQKETAAQEPTASAEGEAPKDGNVRDAEYEEKDKGDK
jgi:molecular chaperone DnaK